MSFAPHKMRKAWLCLLLATTLWLRFTWAENEIDRGTFSHPKLRRALEQDTVVEDEFIVVLRSGVDPDTVIQECLHNNGGVHSQYRHALDGFSARLGPFELVRLLHDDRVVFVEEDSQNYISDIQTNAPWGLDRIDQESLPLDGLFGYEYDGSDVNVYILDTGINGAHEQFGNRAVCSLDVPMEQGQGGCIDTNGHGTHVAGSVGATVFGVAKKANIKSIKVCNSNGICLTSWMVQGLDYVTGQNDQKRVANLSISGNPSTSFDEAAARAQGDGVVVIVAAGNNNSPTCNTLARSEQVIAVGAVDEADKRASFSNYDACVDIWAPGTNIISTSKTSNGSESRSGTSHAAPLVAGAAALVLQEGIGPDSVLTTLLERGAKGILSDLQAGSPNVLLNMPHDLTLPPTTSPKPSSSPTEWPSERPSTYPSLAPSPSPSLPPTNAPTTSPHQQHPTSSPSRESASPSPEPSIGPTLFPSTEPSIGLTLFPSRAPTIHPKEADTILPTGVPSSLQKKESSCRNKEAVDGRLCLFSVACRRRCPDYECTDRSLWRLFLGSCHPINDS